MGYYTRFRLEIDTRYMERQESMFPQCGHHNPENAEFCMFCGKRIGDTSIVDHVWEYILSNPAMIDAKYALGESGQGGNETKWYNYRSDMEILSKKFPMILFTLNGEGEDAGDVWKEYWLAGKYHRAMTYITFEDFSLEKLIEYNT